MDNQPPSPSRRSFIRQACCASVGMTGMVSALSQLKLVGAIASDVGSIQSAVPAGEYKALVCLFLQGGNDGNNVMVPFDPAEHALYAGARGELSIPRSSLLPIGTRRYATVDTRPFALNSDLAEIKALYDQGKVAFLANVGTLLRPTTLADYNAGISLPIQLYSHLDQLTQWQSGLSDRPIFRTGWGGRLADLVSAMNSDTKISMSLSLGDQNYFQVGNTVLPYVVNAKGTDVFRGQNASGLDKSRYDAFKRILGENRENLLGASFAGAARGAIEYGEYLGGALAAAPATKTAFPSTQTGERLKMVARLISIGPSMGFRRQIFLVNFGGWDSHGFQMTAHSALLRELSGAMSAFYAETGQLGMASQVTTFTASDFGRSLTPNLSGSDHAWGNLQWVMGGAVLGGDIYGRMPSLRLKGSDDTGRGRWIPSTSVDEYNATLARWFGVSDANLPVVLPNIGRFAKRDLGFMA